MVGRPSTWLLQPQNAPPKFFFFSSAGAKAQPSRILGKCSTTELHPESWGVVAFRVSLCSQADSCLCLSGNRMAGV